MPERTLMRSNEEAGTDSKIVDAATQLFYDKGYHATSMREIAAGVSIQAGSLYNHFPSKQALLMRIAYGTTLELKDKTAERVKTEDDPERRLRAFVECHVQFHAERRLAARVADEQMQALDSRNRRTVMKIRDEHESLLRSLLEDGMRECDWEVSDLAVITFAIATMCTQVDSWYRAGGRLAPTDIARLLADFVIRGLTGD